MAAYWTTKDFESKLKKLTQDGDPAIMGTPVAVLKISTSSDKPFIGEFNRSKFKLTDNSLFQSSCHVVIGHYSTLDNSLVKVTFEIQPLLFYYYWVRSIALILLVGLNTVFFFNAFADINTIFFLNGLIFLLFAIELWAGKRRKKRLAEQFVEKFELTEKLA